MTSDAKRAYSRAYHAAHREEILARQAERRRVAGNHDAAVKQRWRKEHPDEARADRLARYYALPPEVRQARTRRNNAKYADQRRAWMEQNKERVAKQSAEWTRANMPKKLAASAKRRAAKLRATPTWADLQAIEAIYATAARLTRETGIQHEVDHIVPLVNRSVCGLHVACNLQILTRIDNRRKFNRFEAA